MKFSAGQLVVKISVSNMLLSRSFYENILGFKTDDRYTISNNGTYSTGSYMELMASPGEGPCFTIGLYKDIDKPFPSMPADGTVPSFIVEDVVAVLQNMLSQGVLVVPMGDGEGNNKYIISNTSDEGYADHFFFFCDPDNNSFVIRQNMGKNNV